MRTKLLSIVAILWVAAVGAVTIYFAVNRPYGDRHPNPACPADKVFKTGCDFTLRDRHFDAGGYLAVAGGITLVALVAAAIIYIVTEPSTAS